MNSEYQNYFDINCHILLEDEILKMNYLDSSGGINNVISFLTHECFGLWLLDDKTDENYSLFYICNYNDNLTGFTLKLNIHLTSRNDLTFLFANLINQEYPKETNVINTFNTFQFYTKGLLEKLNYFTYDKELEGKKGTFILKGKLGAMYVPTISKLEAFNKLFETSIKHKEENRNNKIYLMFNPRNDLTKIGHSINPRQREKTLQGEDPQTEIICLWEAEKSVEKELHVKFQNRRQRGEWFDLSIPDLIEIRNFMKKYE